jgi:hypothetical protein
VASGLDERDWKLLLQRIADGNCTPLLGPELCAGIVPARRETAQSWAHEHDYPLTDAQDAARVAQYLAVQYDPLFPKEEIQKLLENTAAPDFAKPGQPHSVLAALDLPIYLTTNCDDFMVQALMHHKKDPRRELCRWNEELRNSQPSLLDSGYEPSPANPLVYHLHGHYQTPESLVLTEDDYLDFLVNVSSAEFQLPPRIQRALAGASLLFVGYNPTDWDFRVLFRGLVAATESSLRRISVTVQCPPVPSDTPVAAQEKVQKYLDAYFNKTDARMRVYWGTVEEFIAELNQRWQGVVTPAATAAASTTPQIDLRRLYQSMMDAFTKDELVTLAFELSVDYESLPEGRDAFGRELIVYLQRRKRLHELVEACRRARPDTAW